ncbi:MAG TPA: hypothetical protein VFN48_09385 [Solirubrobacteraceae bacterium]|nr:hypothetical protein [Solirubrobacteraceae bacterium]
MTGPPATTSALRRRVWRLGLFALALGLVATLLGPVPRARADTSQVTILEDDPLVLAQPEATLTEARALGVGVLRLRLPWAAVAPDTRSWTAPRFKAADPAAYGSAAWAPYDAVIVAAQGLGIRVDLDLSGGAPRWATGPDQPRKAKGYPHWQWEPNAADFGAFVRAVGARYSGDWNPVTDRRDPGNPADLPRVSFWSVWNEPNYGPSLAPQGLPGHPGVEDSPRMYRMLVDAAWSGLARTGHRVPGDTILVGELAPRSQLTPPGAFRDFNGMTPMVFLEALYCLDSSFHPLRGTAATLRGCPATAAGSRRFVSAHPGLFANSGIADHPYDEWWPPNVEEDRPALRGWALENGQDTSLATIGVLTRGLDRLMAAYHVQRRLPVWDTEYGYQTSPPHRVWRGDPRPWPSPSTAALWDNWAEYLHWKNPRIRSFAQYLLRDPARPVATNDFGSFPSGLQNFNGTPKADLGAFRMPLFLPRTRTSEPHAALQVWGDVRPAGPGLGLVAGPPFVTLWFRPLGSSRFSRLTALTLGAEGYYDAWVRFSASGTLEARWSGSSDVLANALGGLSLTSRMVAVTVR